MCAQFLSILIVMLLRCGKNTIWHTRSECTVVVVLCMHFIIVLYTFIT
jgi:hypothetical protein